MGLAALVGFLRACRLEHLQGKRYWIELDPNDIGLLRREFRDHALLLDRLHAGQDNIDVLSWAHGWGIPTDPVLEVLTALDYNGRRPDGPSGRFDAPVVTLDPAWLAWHDGTVSRLAWWIAAEGDFDALPILTDALEDAGCADAAILDHCRSGGPHTAGSRVVSRILRDS